MIFDVNEIAKVAEGMGLEPKEIDGWEEHCDGSIDFGDWHIQVGEGYMVICRWVLNRTGIEEISASSPTTILQVEKTIKSALKKMA